MKSIAMTGPATTDAAGITGAAGAAPGRTALADDTLPMLALGAMLGMAAALLRGERKGPASPLRPQPFPRRDLQHDPRPVPRHASHRDPRLGPLHDPHAGGRSPAHIDAARSCNHSAALLSLSVLADSAMEHYRGSFANPAMYAPPAVSLATLACSLHGGGDRRPARHRVRHATYLAAGALGLAGTAFHLYNVTKRPGGLCWHNLLYAAPLGAPGALMLAGVLGACGERLRDASAHRPALFGWPAGRALAVAAGIGLAGNALEVALLHFRGSFQHRAMYAPVVLPPVASLLLLDSALRPARPSWFARLWMRATMLLGLAGTLFHARGIARHHGGWRVWTQNLYNGPPLPAPPSFTALAMAGLAALRLRRREE